MIPAIETAGFFLAITVLLQFSTWAEGWLASNPRSTKASAPDPASAFGNAHEAVRAA